MMTRVHIFVVLMIQDLKKQKRTDDAFTMENDKFVVCPLQTIKGLSCATRGKKGRR